MDELRALHVEAAVFRDVQKFALAPPADRVEAVAGFSHAEARARDGVEAEAVAELGLDVHEHVQRAALVREVEHGVAHEHFVVEIDHVEPDDEVGAQELLHEVVHALLAEDLVFAETRAVGHAEAHAHVALFVPAADVVGGALGFEVKINDVARHARTLPGRARGRQAAACDLPRWTLDVGR